MVYIARCRQPPRPAPTWAPSGAPSCSLHNEHKQEHEHGQVACGTPPSCETLLLHSEHPSSTPLLWTVMESSPFCTQAAARDGRFVESISGFPRARPEHTLPTLRRHYGSLLGGLHPSLHEQIACRTPGACGSSFAGTGTIWQSECLAHLCPSSLGCCQLGSAEAS